jgi:hypothetical protein
MNRNNPRSSGPLGGHRGSVSDPVREPREVSFVSSPSVRSETRSESGRKLATTVYITEEQQALLKELNRRSRVPIAEYIREGIDLVLDKHRALLPGQLAFGTVEPAEQLPNSKGAANSPSAVQQHGRSTARVSNPESTEVNKEEEN